MRWETKNVHVSNQPIPKHYLQLDDAYYFYIIYLIS